MKIEYRSIMDIRPYDKNPRKISKGVEVVAESIQKYGFQQPIVVDKDGVIIVGHTRYQASKKLNLQSVPVLVADKLNEDQVRAYRIMDNKSGEKTQWDDGLLIEELETLLKNDNIQELASDTGFSESELNKWFSTTDVDSILHEPIQELVRAKPKEVYHLGEHRIMCGDSTSDDDLKTLMGDVQADLIWEDPPYGISYATVNNVNKTEQERQTWDAKNKIKNDDLTEDELYNLLDRHVQAILPYWKPGAAVYWCHDIRFNNGLVQILERHNINVNDTLIWRKNTASNWINNYARFYEPIIYGWLRGSDHKWYGHGMNPNAYNLDELNDMTRDELIKLIRKTHTNYQEFNKVNNQQAAKWHPTVKPPKLIAYHIINSTRPTNVVFDGFMGGGSTLIACEKTSRIARCMEYKPKYIDVAIQRWEDHTGLKATRSDGVLWGEIKPEPEVQHGG